MKCPFCGEPIYPNEKGYDYSCWNSSCEMHEARLSLKTWQALIDGKKAQDALKRAKEIYVRDVAWWQCRCDSYDGDGEIERFFDKEITSITKQENE